MCRAACLRLVVGRLWAFCVWCRSRSVLRAVVCCGEQKNGRINLTKKGAEWVSIATHEGEPRRRLVVKSSTLQRAEWCRFGSTCQLKLVTSSGKPASEGDESKTPPTKIYRFDGFVPRVRVTVTVCVFGRKGGGLWFCVAGASDLFLTCSLLWHTQDFEKVRQVVQDTWNSMLDSAAVASKGGNWGEFKFAGAPRGVRCFGGEAMRLINCVARSRQTTT
mgnify:CR=1 FL=1